MAADSQVLALLEQMLESGMTPEEVCRDCPALLPEVERRWRDFQRIDAQVRTLLPGIASGPEAETRAPPQGTFDPPAAFGRYEVRGTVGSGGFGSVFLGHDTQLDRPVAIKVIRAGVGFEEHENQEALREARQLAQLRYAGIVAVHDVGTQEGQVFIVSDYLDGPDLSRRLRDSRPTWPEAVALVAAVADALAYAHARLIIHRDVKPANILLTAEGAPVLVDFGLALDDARAGGSAIGVVAGTPCYMSPEQVAGAAHRVDGRTDIYSLGVVLYELLTGRVPFRAAHTQELLRQVRDDEPQPPRQLVASIPPELERICLKAMAKRQSDRYTTALDFAADLRRVLPAVVQSTWSAARSDWPSEKIRAPARRPTVGRQQELAEMSAAFESVVAGQGRFLCVTGEPGIGKTTVVEDFLNELAASGKACTLARGRCSERLAGTGAYLPFLEALENLLSGGQSEAAAALMKTTAPNWFEQIAPLPAADSSLTRLLAESKAASQERLKRELSAFLREWSRLQTLLLFIDDLHWADASTVDLLAYLGSRCADMRVLFVITYRPTDLALSKHPWGPVKLDLQARGVCRELALEFLNPEDVRRYLALEFAKHKFPEEFAKLIHARTEGSPLFMADLLHYLRDRQVLTKEHGRWQLAQSVPDLRRELPESVRGMIQRKVEQLTEEDRRLLVAAGVQGYEFDAAVVARVLGCEAAIVEERLDELDRVHAFVRLVREQEFPDRTLTLRYRFVHVLYQNTLDASLRPARRSAVSVAVAKALEEFYGDQAGNVAAELALLYEAARDFARSAELFLQATKNATRIFANQEAVVLARRGLQVLKSLPETPARLRLELALQIALGPALFATRDWTAAELETVYTRAQDLCRELGNSPDVFPALWGLFLFRIARGEIQIGLQLGEQLLGLAQRTLDSALLLQAHHALGPTFGLVGDWATARQHLEQAVACYDPREHRAHAFLYGGHDPCVCCQSFAAKTLWMLGYPDQALQKAKEALTLASQLGHPTSLAHTLFSVAIVYQFRRDVSATLELADRLQALSGDQGLVFYEAGALVLRGWALVEQERFVDGMAQIRQGFGVGGATRAHWRSYLLTIHADACRKTGSFDEGLALLTDALSSAEQTGIRLYEPEMHRLQGELLLAGGADSTAADACFERAVAVARHQQSKSLELRALISLSRSRRRQQLADETCIELAAVYETYAEGLTTPDLRDAAAHLKAWL